MRPTRPPKPIESFGPEIMTALLEGAKRKIEVPLTWAKAAHFRQRINQLRNAMRLREHPQYPIVSQAKISISWPPDTKLKKFPGGNQWPSDPSTPCILTIMPNDSEFKDVLEAAGVKVKDLSLDPMVQESEENDTLARLFLDLDKEEVK